MGDSLPEMVVKSTARIDEFVPGNPQLKKDVALDAAGQVMAVGAGGTGARACGLFLGPIGCGVLDLRVVWRPQAPTSSSSTRRNCARPACPTPATSFRSSSRLRTIIWTRPSAAPSSSRISTAWPTAPKAAAGCRRTCSDPRHSGQPPRALAAGRSARPAHLRHLARLLLRDEASVLHRGGLRADRCTCRPGAAYRSRSGKDDGAARSPRLPARS